MAESPDFEPQPVNTPPQRHAPPPPPPPQQPKPRSRFGCSCLVLTILGAGLAILLFLIVAGGILQKLGVEGQVITTNSIGLVTVDSIIMTSKETVEQIEKYAKESRIKGILVRIDSPGGTLGASQEIYSAILKAREKKLVFASMGDVAGSGGYYIASAADKIFANPGTITGSIGVIFEMTNIENLVSKVGVEMRVIKSGKYKDIGSPFRDLKPEEREILQSLINDAYEQFVGAILSARKKQLTAAQIEAAQSSDGFWAEMLSPGGSATQPATAPATGRFEEGAFTSPATSPAVVAAAAKPADAEGLLRRLADGRLYSGRQALRLGLVDALGSQAEATEALGQAVGLPDPKVVEEKRFPSMFDMLFGESAKSFLPEQRGYARLSYRIAF